MTEACFPGPLCSVGAEVLGPAHVHVRVLLLYSQLLLLPHSNSSNTSRGRPGAHHPPLRGDTTTPGRLPGDLRSRLDQDGQARCSRPARASLPGPFALAQPASPAAAPGTGSSPEEEVRLDSLGGWCLRYTRRPPDECMVALSEIARAYSAHHGAYSCPSSAQTPVHPAWALSSGAGPSAWTPTCEHDRRGH